MDSISDDMIDEAVAGWLRHSVPGDVARKANPERLLHRIDLHGVGAMLSVISDPTDVPDNLSFALHHRRIARELWEAQHKRVLIEALAVLERVDLAPILMKGTALAYSHYSTPAERSRGDSDILIAEDGRELAFVSLVQAGFCHAVAAGGDVLVAEALFQKEDLAGHQHDFDLHWRLNSSAVIQQLFGYEELSGRTLAMPQLGASARRMGDIDLLLFTCVHRRLHIDSPTHIYLGGAPYPVIDRLCWLMDIHLLFNALTAQERHTLADQAGTKRLKGVLADALRTSKDRLGTEFSEAFLEGLAGDGSEPVSQYLAASPARQMTLNFIATRGFARKARFLRELFFPPAAYMRLRFARGRLDVLPVLYLRRALPGLVKHLSRRAEQP